MSAEVNYKEKEKRRRRYRGDHTDAKRFYAGFMRLITFLES